MGANGAHAPLRNPLAPVRNAIGVMQLEAGLSATLARSRDLIDRQVTHLTRPVDDLLDVGRIMSDKVELRLARVDLGELVARNRSSAAVYGCAWAKCRVTYTA